MKKVYFVRHGESQVNAGGVILPDNEVSLTDIGHEQAKFVANRAAKLSLNLIVSSTLLRARQTAAHIQEVVNKPLETSALFVERKYPSGQIGLTLTHPKVQEIEKIMIESLADETYRHSDEETFVDIKDRAIRAFEYLEARPEDVILVVTHGIFLRMLVSVALFSRDLSSQEALKIMKVFKTKNTGITLFEYEIDEKQIFKPWTIRTWNDHAHLG